MLDYLIIFGFCLIISLAFSYWLARKTNMKPRQGMSIAIVSGTGSFLFMLLVSLWLGRLNFIVTFLLTAVAVVAKAYCQARAEGHGGQIRLRRGVEPQVRA